jgi:hypothetical protein
MLIYPLDPIHQEGIQLDVFAATYDCSDGKNYSRHMASTTIHTLYTHYTLTMHSLYTHYAPTMHSLCTHYTHYTLIGRHMASTTVHTLCTHYTLTTHSPYTHHTLTMHSLYASSQAHGELVRTSHEAVSHHAVRMVTVLYTLYTAHRIMPYVW